MCQLLKFRSALFGLFQGLIMNIRGFERVRKFQKSGKVYQKKKKWKRHYHTRCIAFYVYMLDYVFSFVFKK